MGELLRAICVELFVFGLLDIALVVRVHHFTLLILNNHPSFSADLEKNPFGGSFLNTPTSLDSKTNNAMPCR